MAAIVYDSKGFLLLFLVAAACDNICRPVDIAIGTAKPGERYLRCFLEATATGGGPFVELSAALQEEPGACARSRVKGTLTIF